MSNVDDSDSNFCLGVALSGSGAHMQYSMDCPNKATYIDSDSCYHFCDKHFRVIEYELQFYTHKSRYGEIKINKDVCSVLDFLLNSELRCMQYTPQCLLPEIIMLHILEHVFDVTRNKILLVSNKTAVGLMSRNHWKRFTGHSIRFASSLEESCSIYTTFIVVYEYESETYDEDIRVLEGRRLPSGKFLEIRGNK